MSTALYAAPTKSAKASAPPASHRAGQHGKSSSSGSPRGSGRPSQRSVFEAPGAEAAAVDTPFTSSLDDPDNPSTNPARLGYKDELERRFIWDRVIGRGQHGTVVRVVVDRADGTEYACKRMPKAAPDDCVPDSTAAARAAADDLQLEHIRREIGLFTKLRSSLNVAKLEQVYEDKTHVYLVMEMCKGKTLAELSESTEETSEQEVSTYMRSVIRTIAQCHDKGEVHGAVAPGKFRLLSEDRDSQVKATGFGRLGAKAGARSFLSSMAQMAPEMLNRQKGGLGQNADTWAAGVLATRLLTNYFPFDDIVENVVDKAGFLPSAGPLADFFDNPLVPSGAALFVSATVMLLDFTRPHWQPVTAQAKDWVVRCLSLDPERRQTAQAALDHPWIKGFKTQASAAKAALARATNKGGRGSGGVVQRIQRFGDFNTVKQTALEHIAGNVLRQHSTFGRNAPQEFLVGGDDEQSAAKQQSPAPSRTSGAGGAVPLECITEEASSASHSAAVSPSTSLRNEAPMLSKQDSAVSATAPPSVHQTYGLLEHMMVSDGTINRFSLADGLAKLGYKVSDADLDHLLEQLAAVPGLDAASAVSTESFAASQLDWENLQADSSEEEWEAMARAAFDALDLDGDGHVQRMELEVVLSGRCADNDIERAIERAFVDAGQPAEAESMDFPAFMRLLGLGLDSSATRKSIEKYASMKQCLSMTLPEDAIPGPTVQDVVIGACSSASNALAATVRRSRDFRTEPWPASASLAAAAVGGSLPLGRSGSGSLATLGSSLPSIGSTHPMFGGSRRIACASSRSCSTNNLFTEPSASSDAGGAGHNGGGGPSGKLGGGAAHGDSGDHEEALRKLMLGADRSRGGDVRSQLKGEASCPPSRASS